MGKKQRGPKSTKKTTKLVPSRDEIESLPHVINNLPPEFYQTLANNFHNLSDTNFFGIIVTNALGKVLYLNHTALQTTGAPPPEGFSIFSENGFLEKEHQLKIQQACENHQSFFQMKLKINPHQFSKKAFNIELELDCTIYFLFGAKPGEYYLLIVMTDITNQTRLNKQIRANQDQLERTNQELEKIRTYLENEISLRSEQLTRKQQDLQYSNIISMISSTFLGEEQFDTKVQGALRTLGETLQSEIIVIYQNQEEFFNSPNFIKWSWTHTGAVS